MALNIKFLKHKDETPQQKEKRLRERHNNYLEKNDYLTLDEVETLTLTEKTNILQNTIKKIQDYYNENDINVKVYSLNFNIKNKIDGTGEQSQKFAINRTKNLVKYNLLNARYFYNIKKEKLYYYEDIYYFFTKYGNFIKSYDNNLETIKILSKLIKKESYLKKHFSKELNSIINFHNRIDKNQLAQYYCYYALKEEYKEIYKQTYKLFNAVTRRDIRNITIDTELENPYIFI